VKDVGSMKDGTMKGFSDIRCLAGLHLALMSTILRPLHTWKKRALLLCCKRDIARLHVQDCASSSTFCSIQVHPTSGSLWECAGQRGGAGCNGSLLEIYGALYQLSPQRQPFDVTRRLGVVWDPEAWKVG